jgi:excisionase family DNA binding protein
LAEWLEPFCGSGSLPAADSAGSAAGEIVGCTQQAKHVAVIAFMSIVWCMTPAAIDNVLRASPDEKAELVALARQIDVILSEGSRTGKLVGPDGETVEIPASAFLALKLITEGMSHGLAMTLVPQGKELTTQQVAELLHVSRPHVVKLLEQGAMAFHLAGTHRRVRIEDALAYRAVRNQERRTALDELTRLSEELPGGYS